MFSSIYGEYHSCHKFFLYYTVFLHMTCPFKSSRKFLCVKLFTSCSKSFVRLTHNYNFYRKDSGLTEDVVKRDKKNIMICDSIL